MNSYTLAFAKINILQDDIAEVIINEGIEMDLPMVQEYHEFLLSHLSVPFALLINKINAYTYTFEAQMELATLTEINAMAVVTYTKASTTTTQYLADIPRKEPWNLSIFSDRDIAFHWLIDQQKTILET